MRLSEILLGTPYGASIRTKRMILLSSDYYADNFLGSAQLGFRPSYRCKLENGFSRTDRDIER